MVRHEVSIPAGSVTLRGTLELPDDPAGVVLFAHGSGSSRLSPRNRYVAEVLERARLATLLVDLLTAQEEAVDRHDARFRFDIELLSRLVTDLSSLFATVAADTLFRCTSEELFYPWQIRWQLLAARMFARRLER